MNMRQLHILNNSAKTWHMIVSWFLCFASNLPELNLNLFLTSEQNNFRFSLGKFGEKHRNHQTITCQVLAELNEIWSCLRVFQGSRNLAPDSCVVITTQESGTRLCEPGKTLSCLIFIKLYQKAFIKMFLKVLIQLRKKIQFQRHKGIKELP